MDDKTKALLVESILDQDGFSRAVFGAPRKKSETPWKSVTIQPVELKRGEALKFSYLDDTQDITKNFSATEARAELEALMDMPFGAISVAGSEKAFHIQITSKGKAIIHKDKPDRAPAALAHNREKDNVLNIERDREFLTAIGIVAADGKVKPSRLAKFRQINEFLKLFEHTGAVQKFGDSPIIVADFGCGSAHLTFAIHYYLTKLQGKKARTTGIDLKADLLAGHQQTLKALGWSDLTFETGHIKDAPIEGTPDIVLALHACDTATDDALARAINDKAAIILAAPCCHHDLQVRLSHAEKPEALRPLLTDGILRERVQDILTDSFRALILRMSGYKTDVIEFVSSDHTDKNLMIRAVRRDGGQTDSKAKREYAALKEYWRVTPYLEDALPKDQREGLSR